MIYGAHLWTLTNHMSGEGFVFPSAIGKEFDIDQNPSSAIFLQSVFLSSTCFEKITSARCRKTFPLRTVYHTILNAALCACPGVIFSDREVAFVPYRYSPLAKRLTRTNFHLCSVIRSTPQYSIPRVCAFLLSLSIRFNTQLSTNIILYTDSGPHSKLHFHEIQNKCPAGHIVIPHFDSRLSLDVQDYGYEATNKVIKSLINTTKCSHFLITNADNVYHPNFVSELADSIVSGYDLTAFSFISRYNLLRLVPSFSKDKIDLGAAIVSRSCMMSSLPFGPFNGLGSGGWFPADGYFFERATNLLKCSSSIVEETLLFHQ